MTNDAARAAVSSLEHRADLPERRLWLGIVVAPAAWVTQGALGWFFGERICTSMAIGSVRLTVGLISVLAVLAALWGLSTAWRNWQASAGGGGIEAWDRVAFMSIAGLIVSGSFTVGTLWASLAPVIIDACGGMR